MLRPLVNLELAHRLERSVPYATAVVNVVGCVATGALEASLWGGPEAAPTLLGSSSDPPVQEATQLVARALEGRSTVTVERLAGRQSTVATIRLGRPGT